MVTHHAPKGPAVSTRWPGWDTQGFQTIRHHKPWHHSRWPYTLAWMLGGVGWCFWDVFIRFWTGDPDVLNFSHQYRHINDITLPEYINVITCHSKYWFFLLSMLDIGFAPEALCLTGRSTSPRPTGPADRKGRHRHWRLLTWPTGPKVYLKDFKR